MVYTRSSSVWVGLSAAILALGLGILVWLMHARATSAFPEPSMNPEERSYRAQIEVTGVHMSVATNFLGSTLYYVDGELVNKGNQRVRALELTLEFTDAFSQVVLRETARPVSPRARPLGPGEQRPLHLTLEHMPAQWNQVLPAITASYVGF